MVVRVADDAALEVHRSDPEGTPRGTLVLVHGIGGSAASGYMRRTARIALTARWAVVRVNCRNCGGTEALSRTLYNAGQSDDLGAVLDALTRDGLPRPIVLAGFSLGGAMALRYAGRAGRDCRADAVAAVNPPVDLEVCCRALERPENALYHAHFTLSLLRLLRRIRFVRGIAGPSPSLARVRSLRRLDTLYTAPDAGYPSAEAYYAGASAAPWLAGIRVPALVLISENDPFIPPAIFAPLRRPGASSVGLLATRRGGHLGFWGARRPRFWAGAAVVGFAEDRRA
jgi:hypothetical protein